VISSTFSNSVAQHIPRLIISVLVTGNNMVY